MAFDYTIGLDPGAALSNIDKVDSSLAAADAWAAKLSASLRDDSGRFSAMGIAAQQAGRRAAEAFEYAGARARSTATAANNAFAGLNAQFQREHEMLERIHGPMRTLEQDMMTLDMLQKKGAISAAQYAQELERIGKNAGLKNPTSVAQGVIGLPGGPGNAPSGSGGGFGDFASAAGKIAPVVGAVTALTSAYMALDDAQTELTNKVGKFTDATHNSGDIVREQLQLADQLHSSLDSTLEAYDSVRDGTDDLVISHQAQIDITRTLGEAVQLSGKKLDQASGVMSKLSYAFASGTITTRELKGVMREVPDLADLWTKAFGKTRGEILRAVETGKIGVGDLITTLQKGTSVHEEFAKRSGTWADSWQHFKDVFIGGGVEMEAYIGEWKKSVEQGGYAMVFWNSHIQQARDDIEKFNDAITEMTIKVQTIFALSQVDASFKFATQILADGQKAQGILESLKTPMERYQDKVNDIEKAWLKGSLSGDEYARAMGRVQREMPGFVDYYKNMLDSINASEKAWHGSTRALHQLLDDGRITIEQYDAALRKLVDTYTSADFGAALAMAQSNGQKKFGQLGSEPAAFAREQALRDYEGNVATKMDELEKPTDPTLPDLSTVRTAIDDALASHTGLTKQWNDELHKTNAMTAIVASTLVSGAQDFSHLLVSAAMGADVAWGDFFAGLMTKMAEAILEAELLAALTGSPGGQIGSAVGGGYGGLFGALFGGKHADGGSYTVGGTGGSPDSQPVLFMLSPGERADFTPKGQTSSRAAPSTVIVSMHDERRAILEHLDGPEGDRFFVNKARRNRRQMRSYLR